MAKKFIKKEICDSVLKAMGVVVLVIGVIGVIENMVTVNINANYDKVFSIKMQVKLIKVQINFRYIRWSVHEAIWLQPHKGASHWHHSSDMHLCPDSSKVLYQTQVPSSYESEAP